MKNIFLVDADETLLNFKADERNSLSLALQESGVASTEEVLAKFSAINDGLWKMLERGEITRERLLVKRFELLIAEYGYALDAEELSSRYFEKISASGTLLAGALDFLRALKERGRVYIVTNGSALAQRGRLSRTGISSLVDGVFISEEVGVYKPAREYALYVEGKIADYQRDRALWIGDSLTSDCACANSVGIDFILYAHRGVPTSYHGVAVENYGQILAVLDAEKDF